MLSESFLKRVLMFVGVILSGLITLIFISTPESLQVPVPENLPPITTQSALNREFDEAKRFFESSVAGQVPGASLASVVSWSPNGKYILANLRFVDATSVRAGEKTAERTAPYVLDLGRKQYIPLPFATWLDTASWSDSKIAYRSENGYAYMDLDSRESSEFGDSSTGETNSDSVRALSEPIFSFDGSYIAYSFNGLLVYSLKTHTPIRLTSDAGHLPALWKSDNKTLVIFTGRGQDENIGSNTKSNLAEFHIGTKALTQLATLPQSPEKASWVARDQSVLITLHFGDAYFDYAFDFGSRSLTLLAETSEGLAFTSASDNLIGTLKANRITVYDSRARQISEVKRTNKSRAVNFSLLPGQSVFLIREKGPHYDSAVFNILTATETPITDLWLPYVILAPNGRTAITVPEGSQAAQFIEIPNA